MPIEAQIKEPLEIAGFKIFRIPLSPRSLQARLDVEPQQVVRGQGESADGCF